MSSAVRVSALLLALGCASSGVQPRDNRAFVASDYPNVLKTWTRADEYYQGLGARLMVRGTWLAPPLVRAQLTYRAEHEALAADEVERLRAECHDAARREVSFFLAIHTPQWEWNHLERGEAGVLRVRLRTSDGQEREPVRIERLTPGSEEMLLFPYADPLWVAYRVAFPESVNGHAFDAPAGSTVTLLVTGTPGHATLVWEVLR